MCFANKRATHSSNVNPRTAGDILHSRLHTTNGEARRPIAMSMSDENEQMEMYVQKFRNKQIGVWKSHLVSQSGIHSIQWGKDSQIVLWNGWTDGGEVSISLERDISMLATFLNRWLFCIFQFRNYRESVSQRTESTNYLWNRRCFFDDRMINWLKIFRFRVVIYSIVLCDCRDWRICC